MSKICDHTSAGVLIFDDGKLLLISRRKGTPGLAAPAGHVDDHGDLNSSEEERYEKAALDELREETGLSASSVMLLAQGRKDNACRREDGDWHYWRIYRAEGVTGTVTPSLEETKGHVWVSKEQMKGLLAGDALLVGGEEVGLEPVWREWFAQMNVLDQF